MCDAAMEGAGKRFTLEELKKCDGKDGRPAYVAYKGRTIFKGGSELFHAELFAFLVGLQF
jgi:hypothetical protein